MFFLKGLITNRVLFCVLTFLYNKYRAKLYSFDILNHCNFVGKVLLN
jgi:hypothetical protein